MSESMKPDVRVFADLSELSFGVAAAVVTTINESARARGSCSVALAGGTTPRTLYRLLASQFRDQIPWTNVDVFWADERYVPHDDPRSNYRMAKENLLDAVPCPRGNIHPIPTDLPDPDAAAREYEKMLRDYFSAGWPRFDLVLLGMGEDGHTASLFPGSPAVEETKRWVVTAEDAAFPPLRLSLTLPVFRHAANVHFMAAGSNKAQALRHVLTGAPDPKNYPAAGVRPTQGTVTWWVDRAAAAGDGVETPKC